MIRSALLLCAGVIIAACFARAPAPSAPPPPIPPMVGSSPPLGTCGFGTNVPVLPASFNPTSPNQDPPPSATQASQAIKNDLQAAYAMAPPFFQNYLCGLTGVFITQGPQSWGYRDIHTPGGPPYNRYIALSESLWAMVGSTPTPITVDAYENGVFGPPLNWSSSGDPSPPQYGQATPNNGQMTILAALAHEFGHVLWADLLIDRPGKGLTSANFCSAILDNWWNNGPMFTQWTNYEAPDTNPADIADIGTDPQGGGDPAPYDTHIDKLITALTNHNFDRAHRIVWRLLALGRPFPSLLGAFSANEHFVEAFMIYTMMHATTTPLTSAPLQVSPGKTRDIPNDLLTPGTRPRLERLIQCFKDKYPAGPP
jgi:hypothetical protein